MGDYTTRTFLKTIADNLTRAEIQHLKHLCSSYVGISFLERAKDGVDLFILLLQQGLIKNDDLTLLRDILTQIHRIDLANKVDAFMKPLTERVESESAVQSRVRSQSQSSLVDPYRVLLKKISDELTTSNVSDIKFVITIPEGKKKKCVMETSLLSTLETCDMIGPTNLDLLKNLLELAHRQDLANKVLQYKKGKSEPTTPVRTASRQPSEHGPYSTPKPSSLNTRTLPAHWKSIKHNITHHNNSSHISRPACSIGQSSTSPPGLTEVYPTNKDPRGWCLIISNEIFTPSPDASRILSNRDGTNVDVDHLEATFTALGFKVRIMHNLTAGEMYQAAREMAMVKHERYDCFVCCILSHGALGSIYGSDCLPIPVKDITSQFTGFACPTLSSKPKLFFIQACRGEDRDKGAITQATDATEMDEDDAIRSSAEPQESHFLLGYATPPGYVSWRSTRHGSWYISKLCEVLEQYADTDHLMDIMLEVNRQVSEAYTARGFKQCPAPVVTLTKKIYLRPINN